jgi:hypothetical protein
MSLVTSFSIVDGQGSWPRATLATDERRGIVNASQNAAALEKRVGRSTSSDALKDSGIRVQNNVERLLVHWVTIR